MNTKSISNKNNRIHKVLVPISLIEDSVLMNYHTSISYLIRLKSLYKNNTFYNFSLRSVAKKIGVSHTALAYHLRVLESKHLVRFHCGNLTIVGINKLKEYYRGRTVSVKVEENTSDQITSLRATLVIKNIKNQEYIIRKKSEIRKVHEAKESSNKETKRVLKMQKKLNLKYENDFCDKTVLSYSGFGKLIKRSLSTGKRFQQSLKKMEYITTVKNIEKYSEVRFNRKGFFSLELPACYFLSSKGYIFKRNPNEVILKHGL